MLGSVESTASRRTNGPPPLPGAEAAPVVLAPIAESSPVESDLPLPEAAASAAESSQAQLPPSLPTPTLPQPKGVDWNQVSDDLGAQLIVSTEPNDGVKAQRAVDRLRLQNERAVEGWYYSLDDGDDDLEGPVVIDESEYAAFQALMADLDEYHAIQVERIRQEEKDVGLPADDLARVGREIQEKMQATGELDPLAELMLKGEGLQRQYEYARLRCQNGGEPPRLFDGWQAFQEQHGFTREPWWSKVGGYISYQGGALPKRLGEWLGYQGTKLVHWVRDDLGLSFQSEVWDGNLADQGVSGFLAAMAKATLRLPGWIRGRVMGGRDESPLWDRELAGRGKAGFAGAVAKMLLKSPGRIMRLIGGVPEKQVTSADVREKRKRIGEIAREICDDRAGKTAELTPDTMRELTELDLIGERMLVSACHDELEALQQEETADRVSEQGGSRSWLGRLIDWQGSQDELARPSWWVGIGSLSLLIVPVPILATIGGVGLVATVAARRAKRRRNFVEHEREILDTLDDLRLTEGGNVLQLNRDGQEPLQFHVMGITPSRQEIMLVHIESKQPMYIGMNKLKELLGSGVLEVVKG